MKKSVVQGQCICEKCRKPTQVYGSRWCKDCYYPGIHHDMPPTDEVNRHLGRHLVEQARSGKYRK